MGGEGGPGGVSGPFVIFTAGRSSCWHQDGGRMRAGRVTAASRGLKTWDHGELAPNNKSRVIPASPTRSRAVADVNFSLKIQKTKRNRRKKRHCALHCSYKSVFLWGITADNFIPRALPSERSWRQCFSTFLSSSFSFFFQSFLIWFQDGKKTQKSQIIQLISSCIRVREFKCDSWAEFQSRRPRSVNGPVKTGKDE